MTPNADSLQKRTLDEVKSATRWDVENFALPRRPYILGRVADERVLDTPAKYGTAGTRVDVPAGMAVEPTTNEAELYTEQGIHIEDMPIKFPDTEFRLPRSVWRNFDSLLEQTTAHEERVNPNLPSSYVYLTIHQSDVSAGKIQRSPGIHVDGFQKREIIPQVIQHQIAVTNHVSTVFVVQALDAARLDVKKHDFFEELIRQCERVAEYQFSPKPYELHLLNAFCPHAPGVAKRAGFRTFLRVSVSVIPFMRAGNTRNPLFDYDWDAETKKRFYDSIRK